MEELRALWFRHWLRSPGEWVAPIVAGVLLTAMSAMHHDRFQRGFNDIAMIVDRIIIFDVAVFFLGCVAAVPALNRARRADLPRELLMADLRAVNVAEVLPAASTRAWACVFALHGFVDFLLFADAGVAFPTNRPSWQQTIGDSPALTNACYAVLVFFVGLSCIESVRLAGSMMLDAMLPGSQTRRLVPRAILAVGPRVLLLVILGFSLTAAITHTIYTAPITAITRHGDAAVLSVTAVPGLMICIALKRHLSRLDHESFAMRLIKWRAEGLAEDPPATAFNSSRAPRRATFEELIADAEETPGFPEDDLRSLRRRVRSSSE